MSLEGKVAFVSGASREGGIGQAIALTLARMGADVAVSGKSNMEGANAVAEEIKQMGRNSLAVRMDLRDYSDVQKGFAEIKQTLGPVTILVNNAALMGHNISISKTTVEEWDNEVKICLNSAFYCIKEAWEDMRSANWGRIVNISSVAGLMGGAGQSSYGAAKAGLISLAKTVALEGARYNITGNAVVVGLANTRATTEDLPDEVRQKVEAKTVWKRSAEPQEIANAVGFAVSDEAQYMTGAVVNMLGGMDLFGF
ncbi:MAG: SDR family NAD(P)-dependent oxidoreductase [Chloroflexota bacterium]